MPTNHKSINLNGDILIIDDEIPNLQLLSEMLGREGYQVRPANDPQLALDSALGQPPRLILLDVMMPQMDGFKVCRHLKQDERTRDVPVLFISALHDLEAKVRGFEAGGVDFITKPFQEAEVLARVRTHIELRNMQLHTEEIVQRRTAEIQKLKNQIEQENRYLRQEIEVKYRHEEIVGNSEIVQAMLSQAEQVAETDSTVLLYGETGTGKELLARAIHKSSPRQNRQMVTLNCAALPATLLESELFGREKGAYTGALSRQIGRFEIADGSTILLDEIGEMPLEIQAKLLRVLQDGQFERLGNPRTIKVDVRIIAATNRDLARAVAEGRFREDLYYRLNVFAITVPPLRDRIEDIPLLVWAFIKEFETAMGKVIEKIPEKSMAALRQYTWPGNIRELKNVIENGMIVTKGRTLQLNPPAGPAADRGKDLKLEGVERNHIIDVLKKTDWRVSGQNGAANLLGLKPTTLESRMKKLGIIRPK